MYRDTLTGPIPQSCQRCIRALGRASLARSKPVSCMLCAMERAASVVLSTQA